MSKTTYTARRDRRFYSVGSQVAKAMGVEIESTRFTPHVCVGRHQWSLDTFDLRDGRVLAVSNDRLDVTAKIMARPAFEAAWDAGYEGDKGGPITDANALEAMARALSLPDSFGNTGVDDDGYWN